MRSFSGRVTGCGIALCALALGGCADVRRSVPSSVSTDMATHVGDGGPSSHDGGCTQVTTWPGISATGAFDDSGPVTSASSNRQASAPFDVLSVEDWHTKTVETYPKTLTFMSGDKYSACEVCVLLSEGVSAVGAAQAVYFAQGGSATVTKADQSAAGEMKASVSNLLLAEYDVDKDVLVPGGRCWQVGSAAFEVNWAEADGGLPTDGGSADMASGCAPRINEVQTAGTDATGAATDEFVEIYNPCPGAVDLTNWKLVYRSAGDNSGSADSTLATFSAISLPAGGYLLIGGKTYLGTKDVTMVGSGLSATGGAVGLRNASGTRVDSVSYQTLSAPNALTEGKPAMNPPAGMSIGRDPTSTDSNDNSVDFTVQTPTPRAANN
jgi:hypothetical protein